MKRRCAYCGRTNNLSTLKLLLCCLLDKPYYFYCRHCLLCNCLAVKLRVYHESTDKKEKEINKNIRGSKL